jgi:quercetin dioxygenase-like cupin family protein
MAVELDVGHAVHLPAAGGEIVRDSPASRLEILSDREELVTTWTRFGAHRDGASEHVHREHSDLFYVLEGELTVFAGPDRTDHVLQPGTLALAPPMVVHGFRNASDADVKYLNFHGPGGGFATYIRGDAPGFDSFDPPEDGGRPLEDAYVGTGEVLADRPGLRVALLCDVDEIAIAEVASEPGGAAPPLHVHERHTESFYVLAGELVFTADGVEIVAGAGSWVQVPPGVAHTFRITSDARFLNLHTPSRGFGDFVRALHRARDEDELAAARAAFDQRPA